MVTKMSKTEKMCRACLSLKESFSYKFYDNVTPEMYSFCTSIEILQNDDLPKTLCQYCYELLIKLSEFKQTCMESDKALQCLKSKNDHEDEKPKKHLTSETNNIFDYIDDYDEVKTELADSKIDINIKIEPQNMEDCNILDIVDFQDDYFLHKFKKKMKKSKKLKIRESKAKLKHHPKRKKNFEFHCEMCNRRFAFAERLEAHKFVHQGQDIPITCEPCGKSFKTWNGLERHRENEHSIVNLESLKCSTCGVVCKSRLTLKRHHLTHGERRLSICDVCGKGFKSDAILQIHLETHKENRERAFPCDQCEKKFYTNVTLMSHVSRRHSGKRYICQVCSFPFVDKYSLTKHLLTHEGIKPYRCDICNKFYSTQSFLIEHKRMHSGEKPFACETCSKSFISKKRLVDHTRTHTGEKPYKCGICEQAFTQRGTMTRHMRIHEKNLKTFRNRSTSIILGV